MIIFPVKLTLGYFSGISVYPIFRHPYMFITHFLTGMHTQVWLFLMGFKQYTETSFIPHVRDLDDGNRGEKQGFPVEILALSIDIIPKSKHPEVWPFPDVLNHFPILGSFNWRKYVRNLQGKRADVCRFVVGRFPAATYPLGILQWFPKNGGLSQPEEATQLAGR